MAYRIEYLPLGKVRNLKNRTVQLSACTAACVMLFLLLIAGLWPQGGHLLRQLLIPGDPEVTMQALELFAADLQEGAAFSEALETFCRCVLTGV